MAKQKGKPKGGKPDPPPPPDDENKPDDDQETPTPPPEKSDLVVAKVTHTIGFGGIVVRPIIDDTARDRPAIIKPVKAVIPRGEAEAAGFTYSKKVPAGAKVGEIIKE